MEIGRTATIFYPSKDDYKEAYSMQLYQDEMEIGQLKYQSQSGLQQDLAAL
jgi:hypothetical protein